MLQYRRGLSLARSPRTDFDERLLARLQNSVSEKDGVLEANVMMGACILLSFVCEAW
jgi:hypothetical protein